jgi:hypothetical protein
MFIVFHNSSRHRIFDSWWSQLSCMWSVLFCLRRFLEFKSGRGGCIHCSSVPFVTSVLGTDSFSLSAFWILWDCLPGEFVTETWTPLEIWTVGTHGSCYIASNDKMINDWNDLEGTGRSLFFYPGIFLEGIRKTTKTSVKIAGVRPEIWTRDLPNILNNPT